MASVIGLTWSESGGGVSDRRLPRSYVDAVLQAGARPVVLEAHQCSARLARLGLGRDVAAYKRLLVETEVGGLLLPGGGDVAFSVARDAAGRATAGDVWEGSGAREMRLLRGADRDRDEHEMWLTLAALDLGLPVLGICRGLQVLNVALGGTLVPDLPSFVAGALSHGPGSAYHAVVPVRGSALAALCGEQPFEVNSRHHQAADRPGRGLTVSGRASDGVIEAVELTGEPLVIGVQWHPENLVESAEPSRRRASRPLFAELARQAATVTVAGGRAGERSSAGGV